MKKIRFYKYHGTGNDFIMMDNRDGHVTFSDPGEIARICQRRFGIGADGLILLEPSENYDFGMKYYNSDGRESSMCGNGGRCIAAFAKFLGIVNEDTTFEAIDGAHKARFLPDGNIALQMKNVTGADKTNGAYVLDTGSPHYVTFRDDIANLDVVSEGRNIRNSDAYKARGINVNFVSAKAGVNSIRTYERGVEDETCSCGTGTVAAAIALHLEGRADAGGPIVINAPGGALEVRFRNTGGMYTDVWLTGPTVRVFDGWIERN